MKIMFQNKKSKAHFIVDCADALAMAKLILSEPTKFETDVLLECLKEMKRTAQDEFLKAMASRDDFLQSLNPDDAMWYDEIFFSSHPLASYYVDLLNLVNNCRAGVAGRKKPHRRNRRAKRRRR